MFVVLEKLSFVSTKKYRSSSFSPFYFFDFIFLDLFFVALHSPPKRQFWTCMCSCMSLTIKIYDQAGFLLSVTKPIRKLPFQSWEPPPSESPITKNTHILNDMCHGNVMKFSINYASSKAVLLRSIRSDREGAQKRSYLLLYEELCRVCRVENIHNKQRYILIPETTKSDNCFHVHDRNDDQCEIRLNNKNITWYGFVIQGRGLSLLLLLLVCLAALQFLSFSVCFWDDGGDGGGRAAASPSSPIDGAWVYVLAAKVVDGGGPIREWRLWRGFCFVDRGPQWLVSSSDAGL